MPILDVHLSWLSVSQSTQQTTPQCSATWNVLSSLTVICSYGGDTGLLLRVRQELRCCCCSIMILLGFARNHLTRLQLKICMFKYDGLLQSWSKYDALLQSWSFSCLMLKQTLLHSLHYFSHVLQYHREYLFILLYYSCIALNLLCCYHYLFNEGGRRNHSARFWPIISKKCNGRMGILSIWQCTMQCATMGHTTKHL